MKRMTALRGAASNLFHFRLVAACAAVMLTDTALFRNPHYHRPTDLPDTLDYRAVSELVQGLSKALAALDESR